MMVICRNAQGKRDREGRLVYRCAKHRWLMELDLIATCMTCPDHQDS